MYHTLLYNTFNAVSTAKNSPDTTKYFIECVLSLADSDTPTIVRTESTIHEMFTSILIVYKESLKPK